MRMPSPPLWPAVTLTFDLQKVIRSSVGGWWIFAVSFIEVAQAVHEMRYRGNNICLVEETDEHGRETAHKYDAFVDIIGWQKHKKT